MARSSKHTDICKWSGRVFYNSFFNSLRWPIYIFNLVDITKLPCYPHRRNTTVSLETFILYSIIAPLIGSLARYGGGIWKRKFHSHSENESNVFRSHYAGKTQQSPVNLKLFGFVVEENSGRENTLLWCRRFGKSAYSKCFPFKFLWFEERFRRPPFSWRISVTD